ncbi:MAG: RNase adapter RapZ [Betaproteobacteria bacterium]|nr:RNase adapter RapZ [Betaproteobacteria bacterium]
MQLILVSGLSGSGKSVAIKALEDAGYFAVDNLPANLIPALIDSLAGHSEKVAISVDARTGETLASLPEIIGGLTSRGLDCRVIFLEAGEEALAKRFSETRRPHPLAERITGGVTACIAEERRLLADIATLGHRLDTSNVNPNTLRSWIKDWLNLDKSRITLAFQSFGFKHGIPIDADMVFDVRFLPNPFYDPLLRPLTGKDAPVKQFLANDLNVDHFINDTAAYIMRWLPFFVRDNRAALTIAVGCTGGQHRSVHIIDELAERFGSNQQVLVRHRDLHV